MKSVYRPLKTRKASRCLGLASRNRLLPSVPANSVTSKPINYDADGAGITALSTIKRKAKPPVWYAVIVSKREPALPDTWLSDKTGHMLNALPVIPAEAGSDSLIEGKTPNAGYKCCTNCSSGFME